MLENIYELDESTINFMLNEAAEIRSHLEDDKPNLNFAMKELRLLLDDHATHDDAQFVRAMAGDVFMAMHQPMTKEEWQANQAKFADSEDEPDEVNTYQAYLERIDDLNQHAIRNGCNELKRYLFGLKFSLSDALRSAEQNR